MNLVTYDLRHLRPTSLKTYVTYDLRHLRPMSLKTYVTYGKELKTVSLIVNVTSGFYLLGVHPKIVIFHQISSS